MYKPAPARPKKTSICRSRTGCKTCRKRRKKCDEKKPSCGSCLKLGRICEPISPTFEFRDVSMSSSKAKRSTRINATPEVTNASSSANTPLRTQDAFGSPKDYQLVLSPTLSMFESTSISEESHALLPFPITQKDIDAFFNLAFKEDDTNGHPLDLMSSLSQTNLSSQETFPGTDIRQDRFDANSVQETTVSMPSTLLPNRDINIALSFYLSISLRGNSYN
ncbi:hypothetical protein VTK73DRAFT_10137 [Phialemonium thermophilum]|uniref:Zn(2)-C6 fungal-type domain-containing protein n=1 Tax=Phialemonium thermophilum TaxID=223376 RepID=A0ABR3VY92_9PEZI